MRLLACLIVAPQRGYDEPAILSYAISSFCPTSADGLQPSSSCWLGLSSVLMLVWLSGRTTILSAPDAKPSSSCWMGLSLVLMLVWLSGRTSAPDVKPPPAVLLSVLGRDLPLPGPASVLMNSIPIVTQLDIFEPRQETERCRRGELELRLRNLRGVHPRIIRGWRAGLEATP